MGWYSAGADANNDWTGLYHGTYLSYGRKTGRGGYRSLKQGARIFHLKEVAKRLDFATFVVDYDGRKQNDMVENSPPQFNFVK